MVKTWQKSCPRQFDVPAPRGETDLASSASDDFTTLLECNLPPSDSARYRVVAQHGEMTSRCRGFSTAWRVPPIVGGLPPTLCRSTNHELFVYGSIRKEPLRNLLSRPFLIAQQSSMAFGVPAGNGGGSSRDGPRMKSLAYAESKDQLGIDVLKAWTRSSCICLRTCLHTPSLPGAATLPPYDMAWHSNQQEGF